MVDAALRLLTRGDRDAAEELLAQALRHEPGHARARAAMEHLHDATAPRGRQAPEPQPGSESPTARVRREQLEDELDRRAVTTRQYGADSPEAQAVIAAARARREAEAAAMRRTDIDALLGARPPPSFPAINTSGVRPGDSTLPGSQPASGRRGPEDTDERDDGAPGGLRRAPLESTALDVSLERALNDEPPPTSIDLPQIEETSRRTEGVTDRHLALVPRPSAGASATHPTLLPVHTRAVEQRPPPPPRRSGAHAGLEPEWLLHVETGPLAGRAVPFSRRPLVVGAGSGGLDLGADPFVSPAHASFFLRGADVFVCDGESTSGTWVTIDGVARLAAGEDFSLGLQRLRYLGPLDGPRPSPVLEYGAPAPAASWRLEERLVGNRAARVWLLRGIVTVGRGTSVGLRFPDDSLAERHGELRPTAQGLEIVDQSNGLGTWACLPRGGERRVPPGARVRLGTTVLRLAPR
jgi:pSer/pThr/pTyr-binding forkhead associated (FHA) protein